MMPDTLLPDAAIYGMAPPADITPVSLAGQDVEVLATALGSAFERYGFAIVSDHGIPAELVARASADVQALFALPEGSKRAGHRPGTGGARGYTPFGIEAAKGANTVDLKEFWHIGRDLSPGHRFAAMMAPNIWPEGMPGFRETMLELYAAFEATGARLLAAIARHMGLAEDFFVDPVAEGNSVLRLLHYPPLAEKASGFRAGAHEDINAITLLLGAEEAGLEILDREGQWRSITPGAGQLAVNVGDMLQRLTNGRLPSTTHRVVSPPAARRDVARYSMPFFLHFRPDYRIETLPSCIDADHPERWPEPITAQDFLMERLREIRLL